MVACKHLLPPRVYPRKHKLFASNSINFFHQNVINTIRSHSNLIFSFRQSFNLFRLDLETAFEKEEGRPQLWMNKIKDKLSIVVKLLTNKETGFKINRIRRF